MLPTLIIIQIPKTRGFFVFLGVCGGIHEFEPRYSNIFSPGKITQ